MRELIVIRHGVATDRDSRRQSDDEARPLTPAGRKKFHRSALGLRWWISGVDVLLTSSLVRARETAAILTETAKWPRASECAELAPERDAADVLALVRKSKASRIALVGHEPQLSRLISLCIGASDSACALQMKKGGAAVLAFAESVRPGEGTLTALLPPKILRRLRAPA